MTRHLPATGRSVAEAFFVRLRTATASGSCADNPHAYMTGYLEQLLIGLSEENRHIADLLDQRLRD